MLAVHSLLGHLPHPGEQEDFHMLYERGGTRIERIVSHSHASPPGFWYDQPHDEWVVLITGEAVLELEDGLLSLKAGDSLCIPAHCRHRVASTGAATVWLAVHVALGKQSGAEQRDESS